MKPDLVRARLQEQVAIGLEPVRLRSHRGEAHYQAALDADSVYRLLVSAALTVGFFAGTGFGQLPLHVGGNWWSAALWCVTAAGLAARCIGPRAGWSTARIREQVDYIKGLCADYGVPDCRPLLGKNGMVQLERARTTEDGELAPEAKAELRGALELLRSSSQEASAATMGALRALATFVALFGVLGAAGGGQAGLWSGGITLAVAGLLLLMSQHSLLARWLGIVAVLTVGFAVPWAMAPDNEAAALAAEAAGLSVAALVLFFARDPLGYVNVAQAFTRTVGIAWAFSAWSVGAADLPHFLLVVVAGAGVLGLDSYVIHRSSFMPTIATVLFLHLAAAPPGEPDLHAVLWAQIPAALLVFFLLIGAGYRHTLAAMLRLPPATYRRSPRCIVPRLDKTWDHPVEIYVV